MKRGFPACLPVPIFNQKKRNRQPLTTVPQKNEPGSGAINLAYESFAYSSMATDSICESRISQTSNAGNSLDSSLQFSHQIPHPPPNQPHRAKISNLSADEKTNTWPEGENAFFTTSMDMSSGPKRYGQMQKLENVKGQVHPQTPFSKQTSLSSNRWPHYSYATPPGKRDHLPSYTFKSNDLQYKDNAFADMPEEEMVQAVPLYQMTVKEKNNSLRIIPASIETMKHWSQYTDRTPLLFELLATLDSAVTSGDHTSKLFLLRDGKNHVQCVYFEIDQDLPRLIRGRVLRTMGNYDKKRNLFKCVSVRPALTSEQQTFMRFITVANNEMEQYVKSLNDM